MKVLTTPAGHEGPSYWTSLGSTIEERLSESKKNSIKLTHWNADDFVELVAEKLKIFEREHKQLDLVLLPEVLDRIARFDHVLSRPGGSMILTGACGIGRKACVALVAHMHRMCIHSPRIPRGYCIQDFRENLKQVITASGVEGESTCLMIEDHQIVDESFLEQINCLLSGGEVD